LAKTFYITTPIYYVNGVPHVGSATTTLICDAIARFHRLRGEKVFFLTGTDEHAQKVANVAVKEGKTPQAFVDEISQRYVASWGYLGIQYDRFIRTTDPDHKAAVAEMFKRLQASGDIYSGLYEGWYSVADETFFRDSDVENGHAKETGAVVERVTQENYYFRLSAYSDRLLDYIERHPDFLQPATRRNEVIGFIKEGLRDVPFSRPNNGWGIPVPGDPAQVVYVWPDALMNYLAATGWPENANFTEFWPADAHLVGKEIYTRFHATLWPAMLMALGLELPKHVIGHGWWLIEGEKGSKSKGNIPTPQEAVAHLIERSGAREDVAIDALRFYLLRDISFTGDAEFSYDTWTSHYNGILANNLGNLLNRSLNMVRQYEEGIVPDVAARTASSDVAIAAREAASEVEAQMLAFNPAGALEAIARFVDVNNKAIDTAAPWKRFKAGERDAVADALYIALEANRILSILVASFMPKVSEAMRAQLGLTTPVAWSDALEWGQLPPNARVHEAIPLFPRIGTKKPSVAAEAKPSAPTGAKTANGNKPMTDDQTITIDDFAKIQLRVAEIKTAEAIEGTKKLLRLTVDVGEPEPRQLVAGIAESYRPEDLPGKKIVVVANLQSAVIRGVASQGMLLAATDPDGKAILLTPENADIPPGAKVK
jgi:methionyl-tRNA synthetase